MKRALKECEKQEIQILTENGFKNLSDVKIGEVVFDSNGHRTTIKSKHTYTKNVCYIMINGGIALKTDVNNLIECNRTEVVSSPRIRKYGKVTNKRKRIYDTINYKCPVKDLISNNRSNYKFISCSNKFTGINTKLPLNPYYLGLLLGDGSFFGSPLFTVNIKDFNDTANRIKKLIKEAGDYYSICKDLRHSGNNISIRINGGNTIKALKKLNLYNHKCYTKWIPIEYLLSNRENRLEILRGLMDTDGTFTIHDTSKNKDGSKIKRIAEFDSTSEKLARNVGFLVLSLGGSIDSLYKKRCSYTLDSKKHKLDTFNYRYNIRMPKNISIFNSKIKKHKEREAKLVNYKMFNFNKQINDIIFSKSKQKITKITLSNGNKSFIGNSFIKMYV